MLYYIWDSQPLAMEETTKEKLYENEPSLKSIPQRMKAPSPPFFRKIQNIGIGLTALGVSLLGIPATIQAHDALFVWPHWMIITCSAIMAIGATAATVGKFAVDWQSLEDDEPEQ